MTEKQNLCPECGQPVREFDQQGGGTVTTPKGRRWHYRCYMKTSKEKITEKYEN